jgi:hypothetical protein
MFKERLFSLFHFSGIPLMMGFLAPNEAKLQFACFPSMIGYGVATAKFAACGVLKTTYNKKR